MRRWAPKSQIENSGVWERLGFELDGLRTEDWPRFQILFTFEDLVHDVGLTPQEAAGWAIIQNPPVEGGVEFLTQWIEEFETAKLDGFPSSGEEEANNDIVDEGKFHD